MRISYLSIIQKTSDLIKWYIPILNRLPRDYKFTLGERMITELHEFLNSIMSLRVQRSETLAKRVR